MAENEKINGIVDEIKEKVGDVVEDVKEKVEEIKENAPEAKAEFKEKVNHAKEQAQKKVDEIKAEIDDFTAEQDPDDVAKNKVMAVLAYIGILVLIPIFCAKDSKFARFHANQGLILFIIAVVCGALAKIKILGIVFKLLGAVAFIFAIVGIVYAVQGKAKELPIIGNFKILK